MNKLILLVLLMVAINLSSQDKVDCKPIDLKSEHLVKPLGIDATHPRLSCDRACCRIS